MGIALLQLVKENARSLGDLATGKNRSCADEYIPDPLIVDQCEKLLGLVFGYRLACSNINPGQPLVPDPQPIRSGIEIGWIGRVGLKGSERDRAGSEKHYQHFQECSAASWSEYHVQLARDTLLVGRIEDPSLGYSSARTT